VYVSEEYVARNFQELVFTLSLSINNDHANFLKKTNNDHTTVMKPGTEGPTTSLQFYQDFLFWARPNNAPGIYNLFFRIFFLLPPSP
jgi:hypothetical protein